MMQSKDFKRILLINPKLVFPKSVYSDVYSDYEGAGSFDQKSINIGLLAVASYIDMLNHEVQILDLQDSSDDVGDLLNFANQYSPHYIGISCNSCYAYTKTADYVATLRDYNCNQFIFSGGQHIGAIADIAMQEIPQLDCVIKYEGELPVRFILENNAKHLDRIPGLVYRNNGDIYHSEDERLQEDMDNLPFLKWSLYPDFKNLVPNIELSRGCKYACKYCTNTFSYKNSYRSKSSDKIFKEIQYTLDQYENDKQAIYLGGMIFDLKDSNLIQLVDKLSDSPIVWRSESRVDCLNSKDVKKMMLTGLETIDWGLDSASPRILKIMRKTQNPEIYLEKATTLFRELKDEPILNKANIMFYPGETAETLTETIQFILSNKEIIDIVSPKPTMLYPGTIAYNEFNFYQKQYGTQKIHTAFWDKVHAYPMDLSYQLSYKQAQALSLLLERLVNKYDQYALNRKTNIGYNNLCKDEYLGLLLQENSVYNLRFIIDDYIYSTVRELEKLDRGKLGDCIKKY